MVRFRRPRLPPLGRPRRLSPTEAAALKSRPWPRLPWWLWLAAAATTVTMVVVGVALLQRGSTDRVPLGATRPPPAGQLTHGGGDYRVPALEPANAGRVVPRRATCPRLAELTLVGTPGEVDLLAAAADRTCALRTTPEIDRARSALNRPGVRVAFAEFEVSGNESATVLEPGRATVLITGAFSRRNPERAAAVLIHEGSHLADGQPPTAADELAARRAELQACERLFPASGDLRPNQGCRDAAALLAAGPNALAELRAAGYR